MTKAAAVGTAALMTSLLLLPGAAGGADPDATVEFRWAFVAVTGDPGDESVTPIVKDTILNTGDQFKIFVAPEKGTFVYLIYQSSQKDLHLLYPSTPRAYAGSTVSEAAATLPPGTQWFQLDEFTGEEIFSLLAADRRLLTLEERLQHHAAAANEPERAAAVQQVQDEIRRLRWENRAFKTVAERPTSVMGQLRGVKKPPKIDPATIDIANHATRITATGFYSRTFTIDHR